MANSRQIPTSQERALMEAEEGRTWPFNLYFGHKMGAPKKDTSRHGCVNIGSLSAKRCQGGGRCACKECVLLKKLKELRFDTFGLSETNRNWRRINPEHQLQARWRGNFEAMRVKTSSYDKWEAQPTNSSSQTGGVALISLNKMAHRVSGGNISGDFDSTGLGRWTSEKYRGRHGVCTRVVIAYRPVYNDHGPLSVWMQQSSYFLEKGEERDPREMFLIDIVAKLNEWTDQGDQIVLMLDANQDLSDKREGSAHSRLTCGGRLEEIISTRHGYDKEGKRVATYLRGSAPIDGIFVSKSLNVPDLRCGFTEIWSGTGVFDHRVLWVDIPMETGLGQALPMIVTAQARRLKCSDPRTKLKYLENLKELFQAEVPGYPGKTVYEVAKEMADLTTVSPESDRIPILWEAIDKFRLECTEIAERHCRKFHTGEIPWSPEYQELTEQNTFLKLIIMKRDRIKVDTKYLYRCAKLAYGDRAKEAMTMPKEMAVEKLKKLCAEVSAYKAEGPNKRRKFIYELAEALIADGKLTAGTAVKQLESRETQRRESRIIKAVLGKGRLGAVSRVEVEDEHGDWKEVTGKEEIEIALLTEYHRKMHLADDTPPNQEPLKTGLGKMGFGPLVNSILDGTVQEIEGVDEITMKFIKQLKMPDEIRESGEIEIGFEADEYIKHWRRARESTSSGPSGLHFGHEIAHTDIPELAELERLMLNTVLKIGFSPKRWKKTVTVFIEKILGVAKVTKQRPILLFEADQNCAYKLIGRTMMYNAEDKGTIAPEQFGSRKGLSAIEHCLNKILTHDLGRQYKMPYSMGINDMEACYDRMIHKITSISMQRQGVPKAPIACIFGPLQHMEHHVRTLYGNSDYCFKADGTDEDALWVVPLKSEVEPSGIGQGNGAGPHMWAVVSTPILNLLREEGFGFALKTSITGTNISFVGYSFVDDTDLVTSRGLNAGAIDVVQAMQSAMDLWQGGIRATGGALAPSKSYWVLVDFKWKYGEWSYKSRRDSPGSVTVKDSEGVPQVLERVDVHEARRTLGVYLAPDGNCKEQKRILGEKAQTFADRLKAKKMPRHLARRALNTTALKSFQYPLVATTLTEKEVSHAWSPAIRATLPVSGVVRTMPDAVVYGPEAYQGLGHFNVYTMMLSDQCKAMIKYSAMTNHVTGKLMRASLEVMKLELGLNGYVLSQDFQTVGALATQSWLKHVWRETSRNGLKMEDDIPDFALRRRNDCILMEEIVKMTKPTSRNGASLLTLDELGVVQQCRLFLQVTTFSDIITGNGDKITYSAWNGQRNDLQQSSYVWPNQGKPSPRAWQLWQRVLTQLLGGQRVRSEQKLGKWLSEEVQCNFYYDAGHQQLYSLIDDQWGQHHKVQSRPSRNAILKFARTRELVDDVPSWAQRATIEVRNGAQGSVLSLTGYMEAEDEPPAIENTLRAVLDRLPPAARWAVESIDFWDEGIEIAKAIVDRNCTGISDGSLAPEIKVGTAAYSLVNEECVVNREYTRLSGNPITGKCIVPGSAEAQSSYRSEAAGLYCIAIVVKALCEAFHITQGSVAIGCDGITALNNCTDEYWRMNMSQADLDMIVATRKVMSECPIDWVAEHVKGHQNDVKNAVLDRRAQLNIYADKQAKGYLRQAAEQVERRYRIYGEPWSLWTEEGKISSEVGKALIEHIDGKRIKKYWTKKGIFGEGTVSDVDWEAVHHAARNSTQSRRTWISKHTSGHCGTNKMMKRWNQRETSVCPRCPEEVEDSNHVWLCRGADADQEWSKSIGVFREALTEELETMPEIVIIICEQLERWRFGDEAEVGTEESIEEIQDLGDVVERQNRLGWRSFLEGRPAVGWSKVQERWFEKIGKPRRSGKRWLSAVIRKMQNVAWDLWQHRNQVVHDGVNGSIIQDMREKVELELHTGPGLSDRLRKAHHEAQRGLGYKQKSRAWIQAWLLRVRVVKEREAEDPEMRGYRRQVNCMAQWLRNGARR
jgi:hypothetical protein